MAQGMRPTCLAEQQRRSGMRAFSEIRWVETDVLIIGAGVAGMMAVVGAKRSGVTPVIE